MMLRCPRAALAEQGWAVAMANMYHRYHDHGRTPNAGGDLDQSAVFMEAMSVLGDAFSSGKRYGRK